MSLHCLALLGLLAALPATAQETAPPAPAPEASTPAPAAPPEASPADPAAEEAAALAAMKAFVADLKFRTGVISLEDGSIQLTLPDGWRWLDPEGARKVLVDLWGNPEKIAATSIGMIVPAGVDLADPDASWAVNVRFSDEGYVEDNDADSIDYNDLLKQMQEGTSKENSQRVAAGQPGIQLLGWAMPPRYDKATNVMHWAKELKFGDAPEHTLNYDVRVLGRRGILSMNCIAGMSQLADVTKGAAELVKLAAFTAGHRHADFNADTDKKAGYGLAALVGGAVALKAAGKVGLLAKFGKLLIIPALFLVGWLKRLFSRRSA